MNTLWVIEELWLDSLENQSSAAHGYMTIGVVMNKSDADAIVASAGQVTGNGWPIPVGKSLPQRRAFEVPILTIHTERAPMMPASSGSVEGRTITEWASLAGQLQACCDRLEAEVVRLRGVELRFLSLRRWDRMPFAATDTVWVEPGRLVAKDTQTE